MIDEDSWSERCKEDLKMKKVENKITIWFWHKSSCSLKNLSLSHDSLCDLSGWYHSSSRMSASSLLPGRLYSSETTVSIAKGR